MSFIKDLSFRLSDLSLSAVIEIAILLSGARRLVRVSCPAFNADTTADQITRLGLSVEILPEHLISSSDSSLGTFSTGVRVLADTEALSQLHSKRWLMVARERSSVEHGANVAGENAAFGAMLDYPPCCIAAFNELEPQYITGFAPCFRFGPGPWPWWSNAVADVMGAVCVSHFPCRPDCVETERLARRYITALKKLDPVFAMYLMYQLRSVALWSPDIGVMLCRSSYAIREEIALEGLIYSANGVKFNKATLCGGKLSDNTGCRIGERVVHADYRADGA